LIHIQIRNSGTVAAKGAGLLFKGNIRQPLFKTNWEWMYPDVSYEMAIPDVMPLTKYVIK